MNKKLLICLGCILIILDSVSKLIFIDYSMNMLYIAVILFALSNLKKNVKAFSGILLISIIFMGINITNKTYLTVDSYQIEIPKFTYKYKTGYKSLLPLKSIYNNIDKITSKYETLNCSLNSFYDKKNNMTIKNYELGRDKIFYIDIEKGNICTNIKDNKYNNFKELEDLEYQEINELKENGFYIYTDSKIYNEDEFTKFKQNVENKKSDFIRMITYNNKKDYIVFDIQYENKKFIIRYTNKFNNESNIVTFTREVNNLDLDSKTITFKDEKISYICAKHN